MIFLFAVSCHLKVAKSSPYFFTEISHHSWRTSLKAFFEHPKMNHCFILFKFFLFNLFLPGADMITDILTARAYLLQNHLYWSFYTSLFIFLPFIGKILIFLGKLCLCFFSTNPGYKLLALRHEFLNDLIWHFPLFMIVR
jgi:hypothetical protein